MKLTLSGGCTLTHHELLYDDPAVVGACEILGLDPLYVAIEGIMVAVVAREEAEAVLKTMRAPPLVREAAIISDVVADRAGLVSMQTKIGSWRVVDEQLPRIC